MSINEIEKDTENTEAVQINEDGEEKLIFEAEYTLTKQDIWRTYITIPIIIEITVIIGFCVFCIVDGISKWGRTDSIASIVLGFLFALVLVFILFTNNRYIMQQSDHNLRGPIKLTAYEKELFLEICGERVKIHRDYDNTKKKGVRYCIVKDEVMKSYVIPMNIFNNPRAVGKYFQGNKFKNID